MAKSHRDKKPLLLYIHSDEEKLVHVPVVLFKHKGIKEIIEKRYILLGLLEKSPGTQLLSKYVNLDKESYLIIFRVNLLDDIQLMENIVSYYLNILFICLETT